MLLLLLLLLLLPPALLLLRLPLLQRRTCGARSSWRCCGGEGACGLAAVAVASHGLPLVHLLLRLAPLYPFLYLLRPALIAAAAHQHLCLWHTLLV